MTRPPAPSSGPDHHRGPGVVEVWALRAYCVLFSHRWLAMTGRRLWDPITCGRCGHQVRVP